MAVHTVKRSILTTLRKNRRLWTLYSRISCNFSNEETRAPRPVFLESIFLSSVYLLPSTYMQHNLTLSCIVKVIRVMNFLEILTDIRCAGRSLGNITIPAGQTKNRGKKSAFTYWSKFNPLVHSSSSSTSQSSTASCPRVSVIVSIPSATDCTTCSVFGSPCLALNMPSLYLCTR